MLVGTACCRAEVTVFRADPWLYAMYALPMPLEIVWRGETFLTVAVLFGTVEGFEVLILMFPILR